MKLKLSLFISALVATTSLIPSKQIEIKGKITDAASGQTVASAIIQTHDGKYTTTADQQGDFAIRVPDNTSILIVSATGYEKQEVKVAANNLFFVVRLHRASSKLEEVVVSGYAPPKLSRRLQGKAAGNPIGRADQSFSSPQVYNQEQDFNTEDYDGIIENRFRETTENPLSTFSIDVDGASYSNVRRFLLQGQLPPAGAVRIEEMINYFRYDYPQPNGDDPFSINTEQAACPWNEEHQLVMIGLQEKKISMNQLPASNLVFLIDVSGSMMDENKLPLVKSSLKLLTEQLREQDRVAIVVYAGSAGMVLPSTSGNNKQTIIEAIEALEAGGSTAGGAGIKLAYKIANENFRRNGNNRVILCTDGDFNVGASSDASLEKMIEEERESGIYLTVLGYGMGNYKDNKMQKLANKGNGNHSYIDNISEARKVLVNEFGGTLFTIAKDVKLQVEFNPALVQAYRLIGYENRMLNKEDFNNDKKDAGDIGSGHTVTALYEIIPAGKKSKWIDKTDPLKYQETANLSRQKTGELMHVKIRHKKPDGNKSILLEHAVTAKINNEMSANMQLVLAIAQYGMLLNDSEFRQSSSFSSAKKLAAAATTQDPEGYRKEFLQLIDKAAELKKTLGMRETKR